ncbi:MAG: DUF3427 domain-containing protein, partial [Limosilactobacillus sp.]|nr:DUF3427 domain-containing protein [Limosilactobacillus sp.]
RKEILEQSIRKFREVLNDFNFGQLAVGGYTPNNLDHLFISVQTFNSLKLADKTSVDNYDFIIIDEVHHAEAKSYQQLLSYYQPQILLGLTATPDRMDGADIRKYFDGNVASEMLLGEAINRQLLSPFQYYGVTDSIDYSQITWTRGKYDEQELTKSYLNNHERDQIIIQKVLDYSNDLNEIKGIGFCVSVEHAEYMAQLFNDHQIPALCVTGQTNNTDREDAKRQLTNGKVKFIFTVDLYNEGVDIPAVNMVLFLRPTQSATIFLQQLGRGLRLSPGKDCLTVLDFIGQANKQYSYRTKFRSLIGKTRHTLKKEVESNFTHVPNGCYIEMEPKAKEYILENLGQTEVNKKNLVNMMIEFNNQTEKELTLANFLTEFDVTLPELYANGRSFHRLKQWAHLTNDQRDVTDSVWKKFRNFFHIDSTSLLDCWIGVIEGSHQIDLTNELERLQLGMLYYSLYKKYPAKEGFTSLLDGILTFVKEDFVKEELLAVLRYRRSQIKIVPMANEYQYTTPLEVHCHYNRAQIMAAYDYYNQEQSPEFREGVKYIDTHKTDIFLISLNKTEKDFSPSTMYEDYAINESIFHWQSQRTQSNTSNTIQRYRNHLSTNNYISLFIREYPRVNGFAQPYMFMGNADYQTSNGSQPVNFTWKLHQRIPASLINSATKTSDQ